MRFVPRADRPRTALEAGCAVLVVSMVLAACGGGEAALPAPRPLVVHSGARLQPDSAKLQEAYNWVSSAVQTIEQDPSFWVITDRVPEPSYPWQTLQVIEPDSVHIGIESGVTDPLSTYRIYAFLHIMDALDRMVEWFPEAEELEGYELERFIVARTGDSWLLGRATFDTQPYRLLDELIYTQDRGYLDAFLLTARAEEFPAERAAFQEENPGRLEEFETWFRETFERDPPGSGGS